MHLVLVLTPLISLFELISRYVGCLYYLDSSPSQFFIFNRLNARNTLRSGLNTSDGAMVFNGGNTSSSLGSGIKFNSASRSRADTDITSITFSKRPTAPIAIEMSNVTSTKADGDSRTKVCTQTMG